MSKKKKAGSQRKKEKVRGRGVSPGNAQSDPAGKELVFDPSEQDHLSSDSVTGHAPFKDAGMPVESSVRGRRLSDNAVSSRFSSLDEPVLPDLGRKDRVRLQLQSPNRLFFYWSLGNNPFRALSRALGGNKGSYSLVVRLINLSTGEEELNRIEAEGNWWFSVRSDCLYRAEVGFFAPNRPYIRILFSNEVRTPRKRPSNRHDYADSFSLAAQEFAEVLDASGYNRDAFEVALAGDDPETADEAAVMAWSELFGSSEDALPPASGAELRFILLAIAAGNDRSRLQGTVRQEVWTLLSAAASFPSADEAMSVLEEYFDLTSAESLDILESGPLVQGSSGMIEHAARLRRHVPTLRLDRPQQPASAVSSGDYLRQGGGD